MNLPIVEDKDQKPWYADGLSFTCTQCGNCCTGGPGFVWISEEEIDRLATFLQLSKQHVIDQYCRRIGERFSLVENINSVGNYDCVFLKEVPASGPTSGNQIAHTKRICTIYSVRPLQCRTWPFWEGNLASRENWERAGQRCPGMGQGTGYERSEIEELRDAKDWPQRAT